MAFDFEKALRRRIDQHTELVERKNLPKGYREAMGYGMIAWAVPLSRYPDTYNGQPLCYAALASQKGYCALYLMGVYQVPAQAAALKAAFKAEGKKADMGKSCIRFRSPEDLPLATIEKLVAATSVDAFMAQYEASRKRKERTSVRKRAARR